MTTATIPKTETSRERFVRLAEKRTQKALDAIRLVGTLATPRHEYENADVDAIVSALNEELQKAIDQLYEHKVTAGKGFKIS